MTLLRIVRIAHLVAVVGLIATALFLWIPPSITLRCLGQ